jgi:hypothetical protein
MLPQWRVVRFIRLMVVLLQFKNYRMPTTLLRFFLWEPPDCQVLIESPMRRY